MTKRFVLTAAIVGVLAFAGLAVAQSTGPPADPQNAPQVTGEQQKQLAGLKGLEQQLQKDREAVHSAISQYGRDSDKTDAALQQLFNTRMQYRQLRRSLQQAGVAVPPPAGAGAGWGAAGPARGQGRGYGAGRGSGSAGCPCQCPCRTGGGNE